MKCIIKTVLSALSTLLIIGATACSGNSTDTQNAAKPGQSANKAAQTSATDTSTLPNYRYVDIDTILSRYNLAKDYNEQMLRLQNSLQSKEKQHQSSIGSFAKSMEDKYRNNGYLSEASFNQDKEKLANMQASAERELSQSAEAAMKKQQAAEQAVMDSIKGFINVYMQSHSYDAIFFKNATLYINPALDITDEVVEGLNARYNNKKK